MAWSAAFGPPGAKRAMTPGAAARVDLARAGTAVEDHGDLDAGLDQGGEIRHQAAPGPGPVAPPPVGARPDEVHAVDDPMHEKKASSPVGERRARDDNRGVRRTGVAATGDRGWGAARRVRPRTPPGLRLPAVALRSGAALAEDLTAETLLAAVDAVPARRPRRRSRCPWLVGVARHKLVDHWRRQAREERGLRAVGDAADAAGRTATTTTLGHPPGRIPRPHTLARLSPLHRAVLTLRYLDDLPVPDVAALVDRSVHATEGLLVRARAAFRRAYGAEEADDA